MQGRGLYLGMSGFLPGSVRDERGDCRDTHQSLLARLLPSLRVSRLGYDSLGVLGRVQHTLPLGRLRRIRSKNKIFVP